MESEAEGVALPSPPGMPEALMEPDMLIDMDMGPIVEDKEPAT